MKVNFLSQIHLSHKGDGPKVAKRLIDVYFALFKVLKEFIPFLGLEAFHNWVAKSLSINAISFYGGFFCPVSHIRTCLPKTWLLMHYYCCASYNLFNSRSLWTFIFQVLISEAGGSLKTDKKEEDKKTSSSSKDSKIKSQSSESHVEMDSRLLTALLTVGTKDLVST